MRSYTTSEWVTIPTHKNKLSSERTIEPEGSASSAALSASCHHETSLPLRKIAPCLTSSSAIGATTLPATLRDIVHNPFIREIIYESERALSELCMYRSLCGPISAAYRQSRQHLLEQEEHLRLALECAELRTRYMLFLHVWHPFFAQCTSTCPGDALRRQATQKKVHKLSGSSDNDGETDRATASVSDATAVNIVEGTLCHTEHGEQQHDQHRTRTREDSQRYVLRDRGGLLDTSTNPRDKGTVTNMHSSHLAGNGMRKHDEMLCNRCQTARKDHSRSCVHHHQRDLSCERDHNSATTIDANRQGVETSDANCPDCMRKQGSNCDDGVTQNVATLPRARKRPRRAFSVDSGTLTHRLADKQNHNTHMISILHYSPTERDV